MLALAAAHALHPCEPPAAWFMMTQSLWKLELKRVLSLMASPEERARAVHAALRQPVLLFDAELQQQLCRPLLMGVVLPVDLAPEQGRTRCPSGVVGLGNSLTAALSCPGLGLLMLGLSPDAAVRKWALAAYQEVRPRLTVAMEADIELFKALLSLVEIW